MFELAVVVIGGYIGLHLLFILGVAVGESIGNLRDSGTEIKVETVKAFWELPLHEQLASLNKD